MSNYFSIDTNAKTIKGKKFGYLTGILYLAPSNESGLINTCPSASRGCRDACLFTAGRGRMDNVRNSRIRKTLEFANDQKSFLVKIAKDIRSIQKQAKRKNLTPCIRLNGTSDLNWENFKLENGKNLMQEFPTIIFYDYTKRFGRMINYLEGKLPKNYDLTFSRSESNDKQSMALLRSGARIAIAFGDKSLRSEYRGFKVINGDESDLRFNDPQGVIVGLSYKKSEHPDFAKYKMNGGITSEYTSKKSLEASETNGFVIL